MASPETNDFADIIGRLRKEFAVSGELILPTPLGPIEMQHLTNLKGWTYQFQSVGFPGAEPPIVAGGPPVVLANFTDEKGWLIGFSAIFRSPFGLLSYRSDNHNFAGSPFLLNALGFNAVSPSTIYNNVYNPVTPFGPLYGVTLTPSNPFPYERLINITLSLPLGSPIAATTIFVAAVSRIIIIDEPIFLRSIKKFTAEQMVGRKLDRFP